LRTSSGSDFSHCDQFYCKVTSDRPTILEPAIIAISLQRAAIEGVDLDLMDAWRGGAEYNCWLVRDEAPRLTMISHELRCIFVHIQKTGGSSVRQALQMAQHDVDKHRFARELRVGYGEEYWASYFKFAFVRNPWDRLVSWWRMIEQNAAAQRPMNGFQRFVLSRARTFEQFLSNCDEEYHDRDGSKWIFRNQLDYISEAGDVSVDFVGRFERLQNDFARISSRLGLASLPIPHVNRAQHRHYSQYYSATTAGLVAARFARDIEAFGYSFDNDSST
jgi:chondroitin 4-sulfotransferase 11